MRFSFLLLLVFCWACNSAPRNGLADAMDTVLVNTSDSMTPNNHSSMRATDSSAQSVDTSLGGTKQTNGTKQSNGMKQSVDSQKTDTKPTVDTAKKLEQERGGQPLPPRVLDRQVATPSAMVNTVPAPAPRFRRMAIQPNTVTAVQSIMIDSVPPIIAMPAPPPPANGNQQQHEQANNAQANPNAAATQVPPPTVGNVAYNCPQKMIKDQQYFIDVSISKDSLLQVIQRVKQSVANEKMGTKTIDNVQGDHLLLGEKMKVEFIYPKGYFTIIDTPRAAAQAFGPLQTLDWEWMVQPTTANHNIQVEIRISAFNLDGTNTWVEVTQPKHFIVKINVDPRGFWDKLLTYLEDNPAALLSQIIIPLVAFFAGRYFIRKKKAAAAQGDDKA